MSFAKCFVTEEEATLMLQRLPDCGAKNCTVRLGKPLHLNKGTSTFRKKAKNAGEQGTGIQHAERTFYNVGSGSMLWHMLILVRATV